jgi:transcriptional regulator with XRE-family HTH domain
MTLEALARAAGVTTNTLGRIERAQSEPAWTTVRAIAGALALSLVELLEAVEAEASSQR